MIRETKTELLVKDVAKLLNITAYTVRYYTDQGLVPAVKRNAQNQRLFDEDAVNWLRMDLCFRNTGMSIKQLKKYVSMCLEGESTITERYQIVLAQQQDAKRQLEAAQQRMKFLNQKVQMYQEDLADHDSDRLNPETWQATDQRVRG
ncbi:MerR family transcriptional regulator [Secundilactobacillus silagei]|uniref:MerR family transcriptional regulator n=1 Tax=Secundilactobacillus silagei JCM 19001 TaxID=1302250 RepID=A0A1Z5IFN5_9LACO|nr:MerR family transcriptional regulator [Secundilactobacillus silagei]TDG72029.1 hypothetical protein C5L25_002413 [Secundilactobacillus silagei JCM 19001]GAX00533.1 MerR family transcriptional regulator [Secundilactobacillus silagei JCM 19001]